MSTPKAIPEKSRKAWKKGLESFIEYYRSIGRSEETIKHYRTIVRTFFERLDSDVSEVKQEDFIAFITEAKRTDRTLYSRYNALNIFYRFLQEEGVILENMLLKIPKPRQRVLLPTKVMTKREAEKLLAVFKQDAALPYEYRNRLILELLYSCSLRRSEVVALKLDDYDPAFRSLKVRQTKTSVQKVVPVGRVASEMLDRYIKETRPRVERKEIFLSQRKVPLSVDFVTTLVYRARKKAGIKTKASSHSFRKTSGTQMLRNGAKIEVVQKLLGQKSILSTTAYTKVYPTDVEKMVRAKHPRERQKNPILPELKQPLFLTERTYYKPKRAQNPFKTALLSHPREQDDALPKLSRPKRTFPQK